MAVVLSARLMVRYADKYDPDLAAAFEKLERGLPSPLAEHVERTLDTLSKAPRDERFRGHVRLLTRAWAERRVVTIDYEPANYEGGAAPRQATVRPYLLEPSLQTHALYLMGFDETRGALRTFKIERIRSVALTPRDVRAARRCGDDLGAATGLGHHRGPTASRRGPAVRAGRRKPGHGGDLASEPDREGRGRRVASMACDGIGNDRDPPLDPVLGRRCRGPRAGRVAERCGRDAPAGARYARRPFVIRMS